MIPHVIVHLIITINYLSLTSFHRFEKLKIQRQGLSHPCGTLGVVSFVVAGVWVYQRRERAPIDHQPRDEGPKLCLKVLGVPSDDTFARCTCLE